MSEFGVRATGVAGALAIIVLIVLLSGHEILRLIGRSLPHGRRWALLIAIVPLLSVFILVGVLRLSNIAFTHP